MAQAADDQLELDGMSRPANIRCFSWRFPVGNHDRPGHEVAT